MVNTLEEHVTRTNQQDASTFLGRLSWYTIHEMRGVAHEMIVSHKEVVQGLYNVGLGDSTVPPYPRDADVFKRACTDAEIKPQPVAGQEGVKVGYKLVNVSKASDEHIVRRIVMQTTDSNGRKLDYKQLRDVIFERKTCKITFNSCDDYLADVHTAKAISEHVEKTFHAQRGMLTSWSVRQFVRGLLVGQGATCVRSGGGVYFLEEKNAGHVEQVERFVNGLPGGIGEFHSLPLIDDRKQRDMVQKAFEAETAGACDDMMLEIKKMRENGEKVTEARYQRMLSDYYELATKTQDYKGILDSKLTQTDSRLELLQAAVMDLASLALGDD